MRQQLNLFDARFAPQRLRFSARQGVLAVAVALALSAAATGGLRQATDRVTEATRQAEAAMPPLRARVAALAASSVAAAGAELRQLQALEAGQRRIRAALEAGAAGARDGHADYLTALARQASATLWITGFTVSDDGGAIELEGRMTDAAVLTDYLRRLNAEPRFKGRPFAQLSLKAGGPDDGAPPYTEFALRSTAAVASGTAGRTP